MSKVGSRKSEVGSKNGVKINKSKIVNRKSEIKAWKYTTTPK
jgi:hypothetical protein